MTALGQSWTASTSLFGIGLRRPWFDEIFEVHEGIDFIEIVTENFMSRGGKASAVLDRALARYPVIPHGVGLSLGGPDPLDEDYLSKLAKLLARCDPPWFSDHLGYCCAFGVHYHELLPMPFTEEALHHVVRRIDEVQHRMNRRMLIENPTYYVKFPGAQMSEAQFISEVVAAADCGILLDVNNAFVNGRNHHYDPYEFVDGLPVDRVLQLHVAGHDGTGPFIVDTHGGPACSEVLQLYDYVVDRVGSVWSLFEWDSHLPAVKRAVQESLRLRERSAARQSQIRNIG